MQLKIIGGFAVKKEIPQIDAKLRIIDGFMHEMRRIVTELLLKVIRFEKYIFTDLVSPYKL